jgi:hypothetical protein
MTLGLSGCRSENAVGQAAKLTFGSVRQRSFLRGGFSDLVSVVEFCRELWRHKQEPRRDKIRWGYLYDCAKTYIHRRLDGLLDNLTI